MWLSLEQQGKSMVTNQMAWVLAIVLPLISCDRGEIL